MQSVLEKREYWEQLQTSQDWAKFRIGESAWESRVEMESTLKEVYAKLGLPWVDAGPTTLNRAAYLLYIFSEHGLQVARFLRSVMVPLEGTVHEEEAVTLSFPANQKFGLLTSTIEQSSEGREQYGDQQVVIIDIGSQSTKAGWAAERKPTVIFPSVDGGNYPVVRGVVTNWKGWENLCRKAFDELKTDPSLYPVIVCVAPKTPNVHKSEIANILFRNLKVPSILIASTSYCGLCSTDALAGCVVNVGAGIVHVVPYYEGLLIGHAVQRLDVSGQDIIDYVVQSCLARGFSVTPEEVENFKCLFWVSHEKSSKDLEEDVGGV
eukprot:TRINITY_DN4832_c0_g2_i3.p1 TRINITY_DN4832_c0_g2~~TRINITY_DN4832_c0_g2_i3.p1  ORF type:complete len:322 (-),score=61.36 TRINITY_DN4832_c0_g2_i3:704-1669(-)